MIIVQPSGGLCNRMRVLDSAISLAENVNKDLYVIWNQNKDCNCKFRDLFIHTPKVTSFVELKLRKSFTRIFLKVVQICFTKRNNYCFLDQNNLIDLLEDQDKLDRLAKSNVLYINSFWHFYPTPTPFRNFVPIQELQNKIDFISSKKMVGVHIRRTDNVQAIEQSPSNLFIDHMNEEIDRNKEVTFFLATDDPQVESQMISIYQNRIVTYKKRSLDRNSPLAIQDALIDLYCLANCSKLIGSYHSTFTIVAYEINGIDKIIVKK